MTTPAEPTTTTIVINTTIVGDKVTRQLPARIEDQLRDAKKLLHLLSGALPTGESDTAIFARDTIEKLLGSFQPAKRKGK